MTVLLIAGIGVILAGLAAIGFGVPVKEFGFGNTLILTGTVGACTGLIMISIALAVRELKRLMLEAAPASSLPPLRREEPLAADDTEATSEGEPPANDAPLFSRDQPAPRPVPPDPDVPPWQDEVLRDRERLAAAAESGNEPKRRNLLFSSSRRERSETSRDAAAAEPAAAEDPFPARGFADAWQQSERPRSDALRRAARAPSPFADRVPESSLIPDRPEPARAADVTVLKSGVVDGMAYSLYSDGSIEAQMPEGMMRFASIDELRQHLDARS